MTTLDDVINSGAGLNVLKPIECKDGFRISVQASWGHYCLPRPDSSEDASSTWPPFTHVELGYPSQRPEPWACSDWNFDDHDSHECDGWDSYAEGDDWESVYGYVPVAKVRQLLDTHGGEVE